MTEKINTKQLKPVATALSASIDSSTFVMTLQLKDQNNNNIGSAQTIDLPIETMVVSGSYDADNKEIVLTLQNGQTIEIPVGDLISGLQTEITSDNMLNADLVDDTTSTNKFVTASDKTTWNAKQDALTAGTNITITGTTISATDTTYGNFTGATAGDAGASGLVPAPAAGDQGKFLQGDGTWTNPTMPTVNDATITITQGGVTKGSFTLNQASGDTIALDAGGGGGLPDQTGQSGKFLTTDGTDASWSDKPLVNTATGTNSLTILGTAHTRSNSINIGVGSFIGANDNIAIGNNAKAYVGDNIAIGNSAKVAGTGHSHSIALGVSAIVDAKYSVQIGSGTNSDDSTFKVGNDYGNFEIMSADGTIPEARLANTTGATQGQVLTLDSNLDATWATPTASVAWGGITGTLADQTDLQNALDAKSGCILRRW